MNPAVVVLISGLIFVAGVMTGGWVALRAPRNYRVRWYRLPPDLVVGTIVACPACMKTKKAGEICPCRLS